MAAPPAELQLFDEKSVSYLANKRWLIDLIESPDDDSYRRKVTYMLDRGERRLLLNLDDLRARDNEMTGRFMSHPMEYLAPWQAGLREYIASLPAAAEEPEKPRERDWYNVGIEGSFGAATLSPRDLMARHLGSLVMVEGIATRCSLVRPKVKRTVHYCEATNAHSENEYHDATSIVGFPTSSIYPTKDAAGNALTTEYGLSQYRDYQTMAIQEMPERAPAGLLPRSVDVVLDDDLVDKCKPGDRVAVVGIYRALPHGGGETSGLFRTVLIANHVRQLGRQAAQSTITEDDIGNIREIAKRDDLLELMASSVAPSIYGHHYIKKAIVLLLLGGQEKNLANGTHIRGDINLLMVGDPSTAKSQLLRFVLNIAPLAINTTGRGSSGVGLTAAVTYNKETGERVLEAGAMVLADRGVVCIDEFDKMNEPDRVAIHEVMEQQTVTIAKAGIHMSLNARCSVVAAANPRYGEYDSRYPPAYNVNLPDSLISRFDLLFIVLDHADAETDRSIADKVLSNHQYRRRGDFDEDEEKAEDEATPVFQKFDRTFHGSEAKTEGKRSRVRQSGRSNILSIPFIKKYLEFAKARYHPKLTEEASKVIGDAYIALRVGEGEKQKTKSSSMTITARCLETLIRLATAHAKLRLSEKVTKNDCDVALELLRYAMDHDTAVIAREKKKRDAKRRDEGGDQGGDDPDDGGDGGPTEDWKHGDGGGRSRKQGQGRTQPSLTPEDVIDPYGGDSKRPVDSSVQVRSKRTGKASVLGEPEPEGKGKRRSRSPSPPDGAQPPASKRGRTGSAEGEVEGKTEIITISSDRLQEFSGAFVTFMRRGKRMECPIDELEKAVNTTLQSDGKKPFDRAEMEVALKDLEKRNIVMYRQGVVHRI